MRDCFLPEKLTEQMQSFITGRMTSVLAKKLSQTEDAAVIADKIASPQDRDPNSQLNHDFNQLAKDFRHLKDSDMFGKDLNRAF